MNYVLCFETPRFEWMSFKKEKILMRILVIFKVYSKHQKERGTLTKTWHIIHSKKIIIIPSFISSILKNVDYRV